MRSPITPIADAFNPLHTAERIAHLASTLLGEEPRPEKSVDNNANQSVHTGILTSLS